MFEQLEAFFERPSAATYRAARRQLLADGDFQTDVADLTAVAGCLAEERLDEAAERLEAMLPWWALSAAFHDLSARLAMAVGDREDAELERFMLCSCLDGLLDTGDGSRQRPFLVTYLSDEYDLLSVLRWQPRTQRLIQAAGGLHDVVVCVDGTRVHFDVTDLMPRVSSPTVPVFLRRQRQAIRAYLGQ